LSDSKNKRAQANRKNILFIAGAVLPDSAQGIRYRNLLKYLTEYNEISFISLAPFPFESSLDIRSHSPQGAYSRVYGAVSGRSFKKFVKATVEPLFFPDKFAAVIPSYYQKIREILRREQFHAVIIGMTPFSFYRLAPKIKKDFPRVKIIADMSDPFTGNAAIDYKIPGYNKRVIKFEKKHLRFIDKTVVLNPAIRDFYISRFGKSFADRIFVIEQGLSEEFINSVANIEAGNSSETNLKKTTLTYGGRFYRSLREPFELYAALKDNPDWRLHIYGNIEKSFIADDPENIIYHGIVPQSELLEKYINSDIIVFIDNAAGLQVPGKLLEIISMGKPALFIYENSASPSLPYVENLSHVFKCRNRKEEIINTVSKILTTNQSFTAAGEKTNPFLWPILAEKYQKIIDAD
jgi:hypothetical protein